MTGAGSTVPRKEDSDHAGATGAAIHDGTNPSDESVSLTVPGRPDSVRILVQNATGGYTVTVEFSNTSVSFSGDSTTDVDEERAVMDNTTVDVTISDTSGASNTVDYDVLLV